MPKLFLVLIFLLPLHFFGQTEMNLKEYQKLYEYSEKLADDEPAELPADITLEPYDTVTYSDSKYRYYYKKIIDEKTKSVKGFFVDCVKEKRKNDKHRYAILPITEVDAVCRKSSRNNHMGLSMERYFVGANEYMLKKMLNEKFNGPQQKPAEKR